MYTLKPTLYIYAEIRSSVNSKVKYSLVTIVLPASSAHGFRLTHSRSRPPAPRRAQTVKIYYFTPLVKDHPPSQPFGLALVISVTCSVKLCCLWAVRAAALCSKAVSFELTLFPPRNAATTTKRQTRRHDAATCAGHWTTQTLRTAPGSVSQRHARPIEHHDGCHAFHKIDHQAADRSPRFR